MVRLGFTAAAVVVILGWLLFLRTIMFLVVPALILAAIWGWWEIRELRRAMRTPPAS